MNLRAKKSLGQHFLHSPHALAKIVEAAELVKDDLVLEIGPGTGVLTQKLLECGAKVIAVEKDVRAHTLLKEKFVREIDSGRLALLHEDILACDRGAMGLINGRYKLVANIPYYITGEILEKFLEHEPRPSMAVLLVQKEVAERIVAREGKESVLSISIKAFGTPTVVAKVPRGAFVPPPNVDSAILKISDISDRRFREKGLEIRRFFTIVKAGFAHKRKLLKNNLSELVKEGVREGIKEGIRAEELGVDEWVELALSDA